MSNCDFNFDDQLTLASRQIVRIGENSIDLQSPVLDVNDYDAVGEAKDGEPLLPFHPQFQVLTH